MKGRHNDKTKIQRPQGETIGCKLRDNVFVVSRSIDFTSQNKGNKTIIITTFSRWQDDNHCYIYSYFMAKWQKAATIDQCVCIEKQSSCFTKQSLLHKILPTIFNVKSWSNPCIYHCCFSTHHSSRGATRSVWWHWTTWFTSASRPRSATWCRSSSHSSSGTSSLCSPKRYADIIICSPKGWGHSMPVKSDMPKEVKL